MQWVLILFWWFIGFCIYNWNLAFLMLICSQFYAWIFSCLCVLLCFILWIVCFWGSSYCTYILVCYICLSWYFSIPVLPKLWDTELLCTEYAQNYWFTRVPVDLSPRRLSVDRQWNYLAWVLFNSSHRRLSVNRRWNYLAQVLVDYHSTDVETVDSNPIRLSLDRRNL